MQDPTIFAKRNEYKDTKILKPFREEAKFLKENFFSFMNFTLHDLEVFGPIIQKIKDMPKSTKTNKNLLNEIDSQHPDSK